MVKAAIFDVGGVLVRTPDRRRRRVWEERLGLLERESEEIVFGGDMGTKAQLGQITNQELWTWIGRRLELPEAQLAQFRRDFWAGDVLDMALVNYIRLLRPTVQTAVISNATESLRRALRVHYPIADAFDLIVCSAEEKVMKPDHEIYLRTLQRLNREAGEVVFVDDSADNIAAAAGIGMHTVHYRPDVDVPVELAALGLSAKGTLAC